MSRTGEGIREGWLRGWSVFGRRAAAALSANVSRHVVFTRKANVFYFGAALIVSLMGTLNRKVHGSNPCSGAIFEFRCNNDAIKRADSALVD